MYSNRDGTWQTLESHGNTETYRVNYVIGSGTHASGYLVSLASHLFQSPVAYYRRQVAYGLAPGYETESDPDFTRPVKPGCLFCHAGSFSPVPGTINEYGSPPFLHLAIGCSRCHGRVDAHLARPSPSNIVNPASLDPASRDSVCEQCHLKGVARVVNPGKKFTDFVVGQPLEKTFTIYRYSMPNGEQPPFKVISHSEQLALSRCKRVTGDGMWCGTCHDPHDEPADAVPYYRAKCLACHANRTLRRTIRLEAATALGAICRKERPMTVAIRCLLIIGFNEHLITNLLANPPGSYHGEIPRQNSPNVISGLPRSRLARKQDRGRRLSAGTALLLKSSTNSRTTARCTRR